MWMRLPLRNVGWITAGNSAFRSVARTPLIARG
jgi:hypothetical protein